MVGREIRGGRVVIFPTDTVYGLGSSPFSRTGVLRCFEIKKRDRQKQMPVLVSSTSDAERTVNLSETAFALAKKFWPGALTMVLPCKEAGIAPELLGSDNSLGVRMPDHECCLKLISASGGCLIGTSANLSGEPSIKDSNDGRLKSLSLSCDYFVSGECGNSEKPSTVIDLTKNGSSRLIREGQIPFAEIESYLENINNKDRSFKVTSS